MGFCIPGVEGGLRGPHRTPVFNDVCRLESGKEELRARCSRLEQEARGLQARAEELSSLAGEARVLRDEMDALRCPGTG